MSKELNAPDMVTQKMTHDGAILENRNTGEVSSISQREPEENYTKPAADAAEQVIDRIGTEHSRNVSKKAGKKAFDAAQPKTHVSRLHFSAEEQATPEKIYISSRFSCVFWISSLSSNSFSFTLYFFRSSFNSSAVPSPHWFCGMS